jgi:hypothetical protein
MFIVYFQDGSSYSENQGYWDTAPDKGITALHLTLPFSIKKRNSDGTVTEYPPSSAQISGYQAYYFANQATQVVMTIQGGVATTSDYAPQFDRQVMAGIDYEHNFVLYVEVDRQGNVITKRYSVDVFMDKYKINKDVLRKGV